MCVCVEGGGGRGVTTHMTSPCIPPVIFQYTNFVLSTLNVTRDNRNRKPSSKVMADISLPQARIKGTTKGWWWILPSSLSVYTVILSVNVKNCILPDFKYVLKIKYRSIFIQFNQNSYLEGNCNTSLHDVCLCHISSWITLL